MQTTNNYQDRINKVLSFINENIEDNLDLNTLASVSNFSVFHFHRIMSAYLNEPIGSYIIGLKLDTAAKLIIHSNETLTNIAYKIGYDVPSSFTKAFNKRYGISPNDYREGQKASNNLIYNITTQSMEIKSKPRIKKIKTKKVLFIRSIGEYSGSGTGNAWIKIVEFAKKNRLFGWNVECIGLSHDDPNTTDADKCRYDACITIRKKAEPEGEIQYQEIEGGKYAIFKYKGTYKNLDKVYNYIYKSWLPENSVELRNMPPFEKYVNNPNKTKEDKLVTEIYIPIK